MRNIVILLLGILVSGSNIIRETETILYKPSTDSKAYSLEVPQDFKMVIIEGNSYSYYFYYDTAFIFISNESGFWKENLNKFKLSDSLSNYAQTAEYGTIPSIDTFSYQGIHNSFYWKEQFIYYKYPKYLKCDTIMDEAGQTFYQYSINPNAYQCLYVGYFNVPKKEVSFFDYCLSTLKIIENPHFEKDSIILRLLR